MNKESIYQIIGYQGEYNDSIKKAIKKLLKQNHPDHHGNIKIFNLINEVKSELENNKVSYSYNKKNSKINIDDIDYEFCNEMVLKLLKEKDNLEDEIKIIQSNISIVNKEYNCLFQKSLAKDNFLLGINESKKKLNNIKKYCLITIILLICIFIIILISKNIYLFIFMILFILILLFELKEILILIYDINNNSELQLNKYVSLVNDIKKNQCEKSEFEEKLLILIKKRKRIENDLRFYNNLIDNK